MTSSNPIPLVDFAPFLSGNEQSKKSVALEIDQALQQLGFVTLQNHGISKSRIEECFQWSQKFFDLPDNIKALAPHPPGGAHHRGWAGLGMESVEKSNQGTERDIEKLGAKGDVKETFDLGNTVDQLQPNIWLEEKYLPGFREFMESFFEDCKKLVESVLRALAIALELSTEDALSKTHARSLHQLRLLHYPPVPASVLRNGEKARVSAHSDFGVLTLLFQDDCGGLEIQDQNSLDTFLPVSPIPDTVIVNCGDLMERWSNGRCKSVIHRVVAPPVDPQRSQKAGEEMLKSRYSLPFFATADPDTVIEALPGCWDEKGMPKKYATTTAWDYVQMRMAAIYS